MKAPKMDNSTGELNTPTILLFGVMIFFIAILAFFLSGQIELKMMILLLGIISSAICFFNTEMALYLIIFAMLFSPEFSVGGGLEEERSLVIRIEDVVIVIVFLSWILKTTIYKGLGLIVKTPLNNSILIYIFATLFSTLWGSLVGEVSLLSGLLYVFKYMEYFLVFFLFVSSLEDKSQIQRFIVVAFIVAIFTALYAMIQIPQGVRVSAPFEGTSGEPNTLGGYLILIISVSAGLLMTLEDRKIKRYLIGVIALLSVPFIFTLSRSSYIAVIPMFVTLFFFSKKKVILAALLLVFLVFSPFVLPEKVKGRVTETFVPYPGYEGTETLLGKGLDPSTSARITSFRYAISKWAEKPLLGWGVTGVGIIDSMYFRVLAETGLLGITAFFYLIYRIIVFLYFTFKEAQDKFLKGLSFGMLLATLALLAHSIGAATFIIVRIMEPFWFFMATIFLLSKIEKSKDEITVKEKR
ncbi:MAG: O-antigen ligase family protein [Deltaproteobacteria bacterium]|uniref:O-antigen ligase family protein n=1 Tax=Candidatus Zymogenus saltonus TaxID=2844893 RepID=A0A9D8PPA3_9DELT|nr:O-antigen ligase family protein [Candidatus Zymogenus saltonus]